MPLMGSVLNLSYLALKPLLSRVVVCEVLVRVNGALALKDMQRTNQNCDLMNWNVVNEPI